MRDLSGFGGLHRRGGDHGIHLLRVDAARQIFVLAQADALDGDIARIAAAVNGNDPAEAMAILGAGRDVVSYVDLSGAPAAAPAAHDVERSES